MKSLARIVALVASVGMMAGCASVQKDSSAAKLRIRTLIDGSDTLMVRGNQMWFIHDAYEFPGRWGGGDEPTYINDVKWMPTWKGKRSDRFVIADPAAALPANKAFTAETLKVVVKGGWGKVTVAEYPSAANFYTLAITIDDLGPKGASWYKLHLDWNDPVEP